MDLRVRSEKSGVKMFKIAAKLHTSKATNISCGLGALLLIIVWTATFAQIVYANSTVIISESLRKELILTQKEKNAFDKFKPAVYQNLTLDFLKQDLFLLRWIRGKDLDVDRAIRDMFMFLDFIDKQKLRTILEEDWSDLREYYPFETNITDKQGRPVGYGVIGGTNWNIRRGILQGKRSRLMRYTYMMSFQLNQQLIDIQKKHPNVTQFSVVMNLDGFNPINHVCTQCVSSYINLLDSYERFLPGYTHEIIVINAPQAYLALVDVLRPFVSRHTRDALKVFGPNRRKWMPYLEARLDTRQLNDLF